MSIAVLSVAQMRQWEDATWSLGVTEQQVITLAGQAIASEALHLTSPGDRILVLAGKGHNGDDARVAAEHMPNRDCRVVDVIDPIQAATDLPAHTCAGIELIIDGLFGIGLNRPLSSEWIHLIETINQTGVPILAVDVPSGLNADTGEAGEAAVQATVTLTLGAPKNGLLSSHALPWVGRLRVAADIGLSKCPFTTDLLWMEDSDFLHFPPPRRVNTHKGTYGHLAIIAGSMGYHGAAVLAARGAGRAQPGLITLYTSENAYLPAASQLQSVMVQPWRPGLTFPDSVTAVVMGPGLADPRISERFKTDIARLWQDTDLAVIADATALDWLPSGATPKNVVRCITPHPGEAARMLKTSVAAIQSDRIGSVRRLSQQWGNCHVVLKGHQTLIGRSQGPIHVNSSGNPHMAQGGSGDVLAGYMGGWLARKDIASLAEQAIRFAVWHHGACSDQLQNEGRSWTIEDLAIRLGKRDELGQPLLRP